MNEALNALGLVLSSPAASEVLFLCAAPVKCSLGFNMSEWLLNHQAQQPLE